jgi:SET domain-containing protein
MTKQAETSKRNKQPVAPAEATEKIQVDGDPSKPWHVVKRSTIHGNGVYAARKIPAGTRLIEYTGEIINSAEADRRHPVNPDDPFHTFFFAVDNDRVIDGGTELGNDARWINHACEPNCETEETDDGRVFVVSLQPISRGEELFYDYGLVIDARLTKKLKNEYKCLCGSKHCRGTMLAPKARKKKK